MTDIGLPRIGPAIRTALAIVLTARLLLFLVVMRSLDRNISAPPVTLRTLATADPVSLPAPPPPPSRSEITPPAPPVTPDLPTLDLQPDSAAPQVKANLSPEKMDLNLSLTDFATAAEPPRQRKTFAGTDLDSKPRLVYRRTFTFPDAQKSAGLNRPGSRLRSPSIHPAKFASFGFSTVRILISLKLPSLSRLVPNLLLRSKMADR